MCSLLSSPGLVSYCCGTRLLPHGVRGFLVQSENKGHLTGGQAQRVKEFCVSFYYVRAHTHGHSHRVHISHCTIQSSPTPNYMYGYIQIHTPQALLEAGFLPVPLPLGEVQLMGILEMGSYRGLNKLEGRQQL